MVDIMNTAPADFKAAVEQEKGARRVQAAHNDALKPTPLENQAVENAQTATFFAAKLTGTDDKAAVAQATAVRQAVASTMQAPDYGKRVDGTTKGSGFLGELARPDGSVSTELSIGVDFGQGETEIPTLIPTLTAEEKTHLLSGGEPTKEIVDKAVAHARQRAAEGKGAFATPEESPVRPGEMAINMLKATLPGDAQIVDVAAGMAKAQAGQELKSSKADVTSFAEQIGAGFSEMTALPNLLRMLDRPDVKADPSFDYMAGRDKVEFGRPEEDRQFLRESVSAADLSQRMQELDAKRQRMDTIGAHGTGIAIAASLSGGLLDPVGWAAGLGVGKVAQLAGVGARVALAQGQVGRAVLYGAAEGATGNVLTDAALDAAGGHVTYSDYVTSAAFGMVFGQAALLGKIDRVPTGDHMAPEFIGPRTPREAGEDLTARAQEMNMDVYAQAQGRLGPDATPEEIRIEADNVVREQADQVSRIAFSEVPEQDRFFPAFDLSVREDGTVPALDEVMRPAAERVAVSDRWGINMNTVEDGTERKMLGELAARAEGWAAANPADPERLNSILGRVPWLASSGLTLARSENPVARMIAGILLESTTGATGRRRTAAITKTMRERVYMEDLVGYEEAYRQWRKANGGSAYRDVIGSDHRTNFDRLVASDRENRRLGVRTDSDPHVRTAGDHLDEGYDRMRRDQQTVDTIGAQRLGDSSIGYAHRALSPSWIAGATNAEIKALSDKLAEQLQAGWDDAQFARAIAARYVERARTSAYGGTSVPANLASPEAASVLRDVLRSMAVGESDIEKAMGRFSRGGASHTKKRLELDLSEHVTLPDGRTFPMMNAFETDQASLYMQYARRVSGDIALTQYGVHGDQGMKVLRKALEFGPDGKRASMDDMAAFDQVAAEFFGRPLDGTGNKHLGNLRMLTASSRLGGMAFTQFAEIANSVSLLGVTGALKHVTQLPGLIADVAKGKPSELLKSIEQVGGPLGQDHKVVFPYQEPNDVRVYGRDSLGAFDRMVRAGSNALPWLSGWHFMHAAQVRGISEQIVHKAFRYINQGEENAALTSMGLSAELAARLKADLPNIAKFDEAGRLTALDLTKTTDHAAAAEFVQAVHRGGKQIIQGTYIGETGKWAHNDLMRMLVQFRSFSLVSMEKQWTRQRTDVGTAKAFGILMGQMAFALPIHLSRVAINSVAREDSEEYLEKQLSPAMLARAVLNYTSLSGLAGDVLDAGASLTGLEATGVRGNSGSVLGNIPALGYIESGAKALTQRDAREAIRMLPGGNLPFLTPIVNTLTE